MNTITMKVTRGQAGRTYIEGKTYKVIADGERVGEDEIRAYDAQFLIDGDYADGGEEAD